MDLCKLCAAFPFFDLPEFPSWFLQHLPVERQILTVYKTSANKPENSNIGVAHHRTLEGLIQSARACQMCNFIATEVRQTLRAFAINNVGLGQKYLDPIGEPTCELYICKRREGANGFIVLSPASKLDEVWLAAAGSYCIEHDELSNRYIDSSLRVSVESSLVNKFRGRRIHHDPMNEHTVQHCRSWIYDCLEKHNHEHPPDGILPSRIIDLSGENLKQGFVRLVETSGQKARYAGLSHCWGSHDFRYTSTSTMNEFKEGILVENLPQTYQDAIKVAKSLDIYYIWIDSLCIVQDDQKDWERESRMMSKIYANAFITIAAANCRGDGDGFLKHREGQYIVLPYADSIATGEVLVFATPPMYASWGSEYTLMHEPLTERVWALQERYLSQRTLHFGSSQLTFECPHSLFTEDGYEHPEKLNFLGEDPSVINNHFKGYDFVSRGPASWHSLVRRFNGLKLSHASDKLPALSGLARVHELRRPQLPEGQRNYCAGLWRDNIIEELCWQSIGGRCTRPTDYRAPSWSWASVDGPTALAHAGNSDDFAEVLDIQVEVPGVRMKRPETEDEQNLALKVLIYGVPGYEDMRERVVPEVEAEGLPQLLDGIDLYLMLLVHKKERNADRGLGVALGLILKHVASADGRKRVMQRLSWTVIAHEQLLKDALEKQALGDLQVVTLI